MPIPDTIAPQKRDLLLGGLLLLSFLLYANSVVNGFVYDDHSQIERNPYVHSFEHIGKIFGTSLLAQQGKQAAPNFYRPIVNLSFLFCYQVFGLSPYGFHLFSILLNCVVVWLIFIVTAELFSSEWLGLIAAAVFALQPVHTEAVAWIDGVSELYLSVFYLLAFRLYLRQGRARAGMLVSFALALFSKETAMTFPVLVTVYEHFYRSDPFRTRWTQKLSRYGWVWAIQLVYLVIRVLSVGRLVPARLHADISSNEVLSSGLALIGQYAQKLGWPAPLVAFYPFQKSASFRDPHVLLGIAVVAVLSMAFVVLWKHARLYTFALFWMCLTIAPALNARWMTASVFAERYLYLPSVASSWLIAGAVLWCWRRPEAWRRGLRWAFAGGVGLLALLAGREIVARNRDWQSDRALIVSALAVRPDSPSMHVEYGLIKWNEGDHDEAERQWQLALKYKPDTVEAISNLGLARLEQKKYDEATRFLERAIEIKPQFATPHIHLGRVYSAQGKNEAAEAEFLRALEIHPTNTTALNALGQFYLDQGRLAEAETEFRASAESMSDLETWSSLGKIYDRENAPDKAAEAWRHVLSFESFNADAHRSLGRIYLSKGQWTEAQNEFQLCLLMDPTDREALRAIERIRLTVGSSSSSNENK